jgi:hypothetical protein
MLVIVAGFRAEFIEHRSLWRRTVSWYVILFLVLRLLWPYFDERYFLPIVPFLVVLMVQGCLYLRARCAVPVDSWLIGAFLVSLLYQDFRGQRDWKPGQFDVLPKNTLAFIQNDIPEQATLLTNKGGMMTLYTGHLNSGYVEANTPEELVYILLKTGTSLIWVRRQMNAVPYIQNQWRQADQWMSGWPTAFPVLFNDPAESSTIYRLSIPPSFIPAYVAYMDARRMLQKNDTSGAQKKIEEALNVYTDFPGALNDYAAILLERGETKRPAVYLCTALRLRPGFALARLNLARVYERQGHMSLAKKTLSLALESIQDSEDAIVRQWIEEELHKVNCPLR